jgi:hypothetical protein
LVTIVLVFEKEKFAMKKHIFGFVLFSLVVASFALVYAFFNAPSIPPVEAVKPPVAQTETREEKPYFCNFRRNNFSYVVQSSQFDLDNNKLTSKVKVYWNGNGNPPEQIYLTGNLFTLDQKGTSKSIEPMVFTGAFNNRREATLVVLSNIGNETKFDRRQNLYVNLKFSENDTSENSSKPGKNLAEANQVLFVHGEGSVIKNTVPRNE